MDANFLKPIRVKYIPSKRQAFKLSVHCCKGPPESDGSAPVPYVSTSGLRLEDSDLYGVAELTLSDVMNAAGYTVFEPMLNPKGDALVKGKIMVCNQQHP